jgi:hypothetical protein
MPFLLQKSPMHIRHEYCLKHDEERSKTEVDMTFHRNTMTLAAVFLFAVACDSYDEKQNTDATWDTSDPWSANESACNGDPGGCDEVDHVKGPSGTGTDSAAESADYDWGEGEGEGEGEAGGEGEGEGEGEGGANSDIQAGQLTASEWRDLEDWPFWQSMMTEGDGKGMEDYWGLSTKSRLPVAVIDAHGKPVVDAEVRAESQEQKALWIARTDNYGRAEVYPLYNGSAQKSIILKVVAGESKITKQIEKWSSDERLEIELPTPPPKASTTVDVMFMVDTTGSMSDELHYLQAEMKDVLQRVKKHAQGELTVRASVNFYRDIDDEYTVRAFPFTEDLDLAEQQISQQSADGGGDYEEAVDRALANAVEKHAWSLNARARLLFLVLDAPPHHEQEILANLKKVIPIAAGKGIRIIPVASSGIDKNTEFFLRIIDVLTGGTYVYLTNHSGIGGDHIDPSAPKNRIELLNDLLFRLIASAVSLEEPTPKCEDGVSYSPNDGPCLCGGETIQPNWFSADCACIDGAYTCQLEV